MGGTPSPCKRNIKKREAYYGAQALGLKAFGPYRCFPEGHVVEPLASTELEAPPLTWIMFAPWLPGHAPRGPVAAVG